MIFFQKNYYLSMLSFFYGSILVCSQQPNVSTDILRSIATLKLCKHEQYRLRSSRDSSKGLERQLVLELKHNSETSSQYFSCSRLDSDTLLLLSAQTKEKGKITIASCRSKGDFADQLDKMDNFIASRRDEISNAKLLILFCENDAGVCLQSQNFLKNFEKKLQAIISVDPVVIGYSMIPGKLHRNKDHFECQIDEDKTLWRSAIDNFEHHNL